MRASLRTIILATVMTSAGATLAMGCGADAPAAANSAAPATASTPPDACSEIAGFCHIHDEKGGAAIIHECHELGHAHQLDACVARKKECIDACAAHGH